jgi:4-diphosphocytidyl-2-C-methyl-D-erythritol kinase
MIRERAPAKVNLVLHVGAPRPDGMHPLSSLFARLDLADDVTVVEAPRDEVICPGVTGANLAERALAAFREAAPGAAPPAAVRIEKRIPVAAGLGGGSADAAAVLRAANALAGGPLRPPELRALATGIGSDVPSQVEPRHALVSGAGEVVEPVTLPALALVLVPAAYGLAAHEVYAELDRARRWREHLEPKRMRLLASAPLEQLAAAVENDLQPAIISLRPELEVTLTALRARGALAAAISGSGPTAFGVFPDVAAARAAASAFDDAIVARAEDAA